MAEPPKAPSVASSPAARVVRDTLLEYARRGVFRGFDHEDTSEGVVFRFHWMGPRPYQIALRTAGDGTDSLVARRLLPAVSEHPGLQSDLETLLADRASLPPHRRVDPDRASATLTPDGAGALELVVSIRNGHHEYATRKLLNLINEMWVRLQDRHQRYLWEVFQAPRE